MSSDIVVDNVFSSDEPEHPSQLVLPPNLQEELTNLSVGEFAVSSLVIQKVKSLLVQLISKSLPLPSFLTPVQNGNPNLVFVEWSSPHFLIMTLGNSDEIKIETKTHEYSLPSSSDIVLLSLQNYFLRTFN